jgi:hypothetical protein
VVELGQHLERELGADRLGVVEQRAERRPRQR